MKVTIILPVYNRAVIVSRAIKSVLNQSYDNFELIVIDDGSTDNIDEVISEFEDTRILYRKLVQNGGVSNARNYGLKFSSGEAICFLDSDDEFNPDYLQKMCNKMQKVGAVVVACTARYSESTNYPTKMQLSSYHDAKDKYAYLLGGNIFPLPCLFFHRGVKDQLYFDPSYAAYEDYAMLLDLLSSSNEIILLKEELVNVYDSDDGVNKNYDSIFRTLDSLQKKHAKKLQKDRLTHYEFLKNLLGLARRAGNKRKIIFALVKMAWFRYLYRDLYDLLLSGMVALRAKISKIEGR